MNPTLRISCPDPRQPGTWRVETPGGEALRGASRVEITLDAEHHLATAVVTFIGVHVDVLAEAERLVRVAGVDCPLAPGDVPAFAARVTLPTEGKGS